ncbi:antibiotic biosynthesis monooxygenase [Actinomadura chokoriensis]|uniref:Antibiotic biosynthesis monooxygenase n=1 Tax=Actinomadura chokoriensis TaxID=454156 RepID=A0ABV4QYE4_9ACTN
MIRAVLTMLVREGCEAAFEDVWRRAMRDTQPRGSLGQALTCDPQLRRRYIITGDWESSEALRAFESSAERRSMSAAFEPLRESASKQVLEIIARV